MAVRLEDLSPKAQAKARAQIGVAPHRKRTRARVRDELERALFTELKMMNLPLPVKQYRFNKHNAGPHGKDDWRFDFAWPNKMFAVEVDGGTWTGGAHVRGKRYERDCLKNNEAVLQGWQIAHVTTDMVRDGRAVAYIERFFQTVGKAG